MTVITTSDTVQQAFITALDGKTAAGANIFSPRTWPIALDGMPVVLVQSPKERKESLGPNAPSYDVLATIRVVGRLTFKALPDDAAATQALAALSILQRQIEVAVINNYALFLLISEIVSVDTVNDVKSEGNQPIAELTMDFVCKFYQGPECFAQPVLTPINELAIYGDLLNVFDPTGTYVPPAPGDPVVPPPRDIGPDGRIEIGAIVSTS